MFEAFWLAVCVAFLVPMAIEFTWLSIKPIFDYFRRKEGK